jgi:hypothetical protein
VSIPPCCPFQHAPLRLVLPGARHFAKAASKNHEDQWLVAAQYFADHFEAA